MRYSLAIFDMDGTILNTLEDMTDSVNYTLQSFGMPQRSLDDVRRFVGNGIPKLIGRAVPDGTDAAVTKQVLSFYMDWYVSHCELKTRPYDGIPELLKKLRASGIRTAVVSNKADTAVAKLSALYFPGLFDCTVGAREGIANKPAPDSVLEVLRSMRCEKKNAVYIGDSDVDVATAKNSGLDCLAVSWGFRDVSFLKEHGANVIVHKPADLYPYIVG